MRTEGPRDITSINSDPDETTPLVQSPSSLTRSQESVNTNLIVSKHRNRRSSFWQKAKLKGENSVLFHGEVAGVFTLSAAVFL